MYILQSNLTLQTNNGNAIKYLKEKSYIIFIIVKYADNKNTLYPFTILNEN